MSQCPHCSIPLDLSGIAGGSVVNCPRCAKPFRTPGEFAPPPSPARRGVPTGGPTVQIQTESSIQRFRGRVDHWKASTSFWDVFDWKFETYVTPWVIRVTWIWLVCLAVLMLVFAILSVVGGTLGDVLPSFPEPASSRRAPAWEFRVPENMRPGEDSAASQAAGKTLATFASILARIIGVIVLFSLMLLWLLWCRVGLESVIVIFNIAATLKSIDAAVHKSEG